MATACTATTRQGTQCKLRARQGHTTCTRHSVALPQCPVCFGDMSMSNTRTLECGHAFHTRCLDRWKRTSRTCPMCRTPFDQPMYKVRISVQRVNDSHFITESYTTSNVAGIESAFGMDPMMDPRFVTDILFEIAANESLSEVLRQLGLNMPSGPFEPFEAPVALPRI